MEGQHICFASKYWCKNQEVRLVAALAQRKVNKRSCLFSP